VRAFLALLVAILASIGIGVGVVAAIGKSVPTNKTQFAESALKSLGSSPYLQMSGSIKATGLPKSDQFIAQLSETVDVSSDDGSTELSYANINHIGIAIDLARGSKDLLQIRLIDAKAIYLSANLSSIAKLPGISAKIRQELSTAGILFDNRWFQLPSSVMAPISKALNNAEKQQSSDGNSISASRAKQLENQILTAARKNGSARLSTAANGDDHLHATLSVLPFVRQLLPKFLQLIKNSLSQLPVGSVPKIGSGELSGLNGTATMDLYTNPGTTILNRVVTGFSNAKNTVQAMEKVSHTNTSIGAPSGALTLPKSITNAFGHVKLPSLA
jgi:hypothetical protein